MTNIVYPKNFSIENWQTFFDLSSDHFLPINSALPRYQNEDYSVVHHLGNLDFEDDQKCNIYLLRTERQLTERSSRKKQFDLATNIIREEKIQTGLFIFYDEDDNFRMSLVYPIYKGTKREFSNYRRHSFYVHKDLPNKTYKLQMEEHKFNSMSELKETFSVEKVSDLFYAEFEKEYEKLQSEIVHLFDSHIDEDLRKDFSLLFVIRIIFLGFVQKKGWLGNNQNFIKEYINSYDKALQPRGIYQDLLVPLFFTALNQSPQSKNKYGFPDIEEPFKSHLVNAPYLNGGLFREHQNVDNEALYITDEGVKKFIEFLFSFNFTLEENTHYDEELELNPEFLGIIFEKLVNKENGAVYTPRLEVDFMCRLALLKYLQNNLSFQPDLENIYRLFFPEYTNNGERSIGDFSAEHAKEIVEKIEAVTVCDPAIGSGAFAVGMLNVIDEIESAVIENFLPESHQKRTSAYERKKRIIFKSLYGVEVKEWAVWITQLRLWITLLIEAEDSMKESVEPLLPSFDFKIRQGDSLVQMIGDELFPISGKGIVSSSISRKINRLTELKTEHYYNRCEVKLNDIRLLHQELYTSILKNRQKELEKTIARFKGLQVSEVQEDFLYGDLQTEIDFLTEKEKRELWKLELELDDLKHEIDDFSQSDLPFIWRIDFPEIFLGKGGFDIVIGNPPYVAHRKIADPRGVISNEKKYKNELKKMAAQDFPQFISEEMVEGRSDLYVFFYIRGLRLLNSNGNLAYICSNSWLDVEFGFWLQKLLFERCVPYYIFNNQAQRSFKNAHVNTIISVIGLNRKNSLGENKTKIVTLKLPFEECVYAENLQLVDETQHSIDYTDIKIYPVSLNEIVEDNAKILDNDNNHLLNSGFTGTKLGSLYMLAPKTFWNIVSNKKDFLNPISQLFDYKRGLTTNAVKFFFMNNNTTGIPVENDYLVPIITSSQHIHQLQFSNDDFLFSCHKKKDDLRNTNALRYIEHWEDSKKPAVLTDLWYSLKHEEASLLLFRFWDKRFFTPTPTNNMIASDNFFIGYNLKYDKEAILALMNSTFYFWQIEIFGRKNQGQGILNTYGLEYKYLRLPKISLFNIDKLKHAFQVLCSRNVLSYKDEVEQNDKKYLDALVFDALELNDAERREIVESYVSLVDMRMSRATSLQRNN